MISIVIPTLNEEKAIGDTVKAFASLTIPHEVIVSDGMSSDRTVAIAGANGAKTVVLSGPQPIGRISHGRNVGAKASQGEIIVFLDADCRVGEPNAFFGEVLTRFEKEKELVGLLPKLRISPDKETVIDRFFFAIMNVMIRFQNNVLHKGDAGGGECQMVRREAFFRINGYREDLVTREDRDLFMRLSKIGRTRLDPKLTVYHPGRRVHEKGWPHMIGLFIFNTVYFHIFGRVYTKEWKEVR